MPVRHAGRGPGDRRSAGAAQLFKHGDLKGWLKIAFDKVDAWFEEDEEIFVHPKDPYKVRYLVYGWGEALTREQRTDVLQASREVRVEINGVDLAKTNKARLLFETGLPVRTYIPKTDVRLEHLEPSDLMSACPYKVRSFFFPTHL